MRSPQIDFGCFEELARVMYQPQPSGPSQKLDPGQELRLEHRSEAFCRSHTPVMASGLQVGQVFYAERLMNLADLMGRKARNTEHLQDPRRRGGAQRFEFRCRASRV